MFTERATPLFADMKEKRKASYSEGLALLFLLAYFRVLHSLFVVGICFDYLPCLLTFLMAFSTLVLKLSFSQSLLLFSHLSFS